MGKRKRALQRRKRLVITAAAFVGGGALAAAAWLASGRAHRAAVGADDATP
jgi:hypothetical protein